MRSLSIDKDWLYEQYVENNKICKEIGEMVGCSAQTVSRYLRKYDITKEHITESQLYEEYIINGLSSREVASKIGLSKYYVLKKLRQYGIKIRHCNSLSILKNKQWLYEEYWIKTKSTGVISTEIGCHISSVHSAMHTHNIPFRNKIKYSGLRDYDWLYNQYIVLGKNTVEIANRLGCDKAVVNRSLKRLGIKARSKSEALKGRQFTEGTKIKMSKAKDGMFFGDENPNWNGGSSFEPYCIKFNNKLRERIRERDNRICQLCGVGENGRRHSVHHVHYDKENCYPDLITLCTSCNSKVNGNRDYYEKLLMKNLEERGLLLYLTGLNI